MRLVRLWLGYSPDVTCALHLKIRSWYVRIGPWVKARAKHYRWPGPEPL